MDEMADREARFMNALRPIQSSLEKYAIGLTSDRDNAKDLVQDAVVIAWKNFDTIRDVAAFKSYLFTIVTNLSRKHYQRRRLVDRLTVESEENIRSSQQSPERFADAQLVKDALHKLPQKSREALVLFEINDLSVEEISRVQRSSISAVKVRLMRARRALALMLDIKEMRGTHVNV